MLLSKDCNVVIAADDIGYCCIEFRYHLYHKVVIAADDIGYCCIGFRYHLDRNVVIGAGAWLYSTPSFSLIEATLSFTCNYNITFVKLRYSKIQ
jgi:hypothetical protein